MQVRPSPAPPALVSALTAAVLMAVVAGCGDEPRTALPADPPPASSAAPTAAPSAAPSADPSASPAPASPEAPALPAPDEPIPGNAAELATALERTSAALADAVDAWDGDGAPPRDVELLALHQQRIYRHTARHPKLAARAFARLPDRLAAEAEDNTAAIRELLSLAHPIKGDATLKLRPARPAGELLGHFKKAERRFGVEWEVLAAVMLAETKFGRVRSASHVGAQGPMQFMPATWKAYGMGGDIQDTRDAVMAAANYLHATGAPRDYQRALHAYNPSQSYVDAILLHARQMKRDPRNYFVYYNWQVYVITTKGERRLTGP